SLSSRAALPLPAHATATTVIYTLSYTTLFRSRVDLVLAGVLGRRAVGGLVDGDARAVVDVGAGRDADAAHLRGESVGEVVAVEVDRKSTRLNSSHVKISYAVFCLKKKK